MNCKLQIFNKTGLAFGLSLLFVFVVFSISYAQTKAARTRENWELVSTTNAQFIYRGTHGLSVTDHQTIIAWEKVVPRLDTPEGRESRQSRIQSLTKMIGAERANTYSHYLKIEEYDCREGSTRTLQFKFSDRAGRNIQNIPEFHYSKGGRVIQGPPPPIGKNEKPNWFHPAPDSVGEKMLRAVCSANDEGQTSIEDSGNDDFYISRAGRFRIKFPQGWPVTEESKGGVFVKAANGGGSSINVIASRYDGPEPKEESLNAMVNLGVVATKKDYPSAVILDKGLRYLAGKRGAYQRFRVTYHVEGSNMTHITTNYTVFQNGLAYTITTSVPLSAYDEVEPLLKASLNSFTVGREPFR